MEFAKIKMCNIIFYVFNCPFYGFYRWSEKNKTKQFQPQMIAARGDNRFGSTQVNKKV